MYSSVNLAFLANLKPGKQAWMICLLCRTQAAQCAKAWLIPGKTTKIIFLFLNPYYMNISDVQILLYWKEVLCLLYLSYNDIFWLRCTWSQALWGKYVGICGLSLCGFVPRVKALQNQLCPISSEFLSWRRFSVIIVLMITCGEPPGSHHSCGHLLEAKGHFLTLEKPSHCLVPSQCHSRAETE